MPTKKTAAAIAPAPSAWALNGFRYWRIATADAEIVASIPFTYTPHFPPMHAKYEIYSVKKGLAKFLGYLEGEQLARAHQAFVTAFRR